MGLLLALFVLPLNACDGAPLSKQLRDIKRIEVQLRKSLGKKTVPPKELAPAIYRMARRYNVRETLIIRVIAVESRGNPAAYNHNTDDCGLMQLNKRTISLYGGSATKLCSAKNWRLNLELGVRILASADRVCEYNVGPRVSRKLQACLNYERKIASIEL